MKQSVRGGVVREERLDRILSALRELAAVAWRAPVLVAGAGAGFALAGVAAVVLLAHGRMIGAEGDVYKAMTFNFAVALYLLTLAVLLPLARMGPRLYRGWMAVHTAALLPFFGIENVQVYRGVDPRFTEVGSALDEAIGGIFGLNALVVIALFLVLAARFYRRPVDARDRLLLIGARYGSAAVVLAFIAGIGMSALSGSAVGGEGDLLLVHAAGFHGLQAAPLVGWLAGTRAHEPRAALVVHCAGLAWLAATLAIGWQAASGDAAFEVSAMNVAAITALLVWLALAAVAGRGRFVVPAPAAAGAT